MNNEYMLVLAKMIDTFFLNGYSRKSGDYIILLSTKKISRSDRLYRFVIAASRHINY